MGVGFPFSHLGLEQTAVFVTPGQGGARGLLRVPASAFPLCAHMARVLPWRRVGNVTPCTDAADFARFGVCSAGGAWVGSRGCHF